MKLRRLIPLLAAAGCINPVPIVDRPCPCAAGWICDPRTNTCVHDTDGSIPSVTFTAAPNLSRAVATFEFTVSDPFATIACKVDANAFAPCRSPFDSPPLPEGPHQLTVRATSLLDQTGSADARWTVDTTPPAVTFGAPFDHDLATPIVHVSFTVPDAAPDAVIECDSDGAGFAPCSSPYTPPPLSDGEHMVTVRTRDAAGNLGTGIRSYRIDTVAPVVTIAALSSPTGIVPSIAFTASDAAAPLALECQIDGAAFAACASPFLPSPLDNGDHTAFVRATDPAGNIAIESRHFVVAAPANRHTIHIDGVNDFFVSDTRGEALSTTTSSIVDAFVTWDDSNVYVGWSAGLIGVSADPSRGFTVYVDVDPGADAGAATAEPFVNQAATLPPGFLADYFLRWTTDGALTLARYNGATWTAMSATGVSVGTSLGFVEVAIPLAQLGSPTHFGLLGLWQLSGAGIEQTRSGWYSDSFVDGDHRAANPAPIQRWLDVNLASPLPPNAPANKR